MISAVLFLGLVATVLSAPACCTHHHWEGEAHGRVLADGKFSRFFEFISYDFTAKRLRIDVFDDLVSQNKTVFASIFDYQHHDGTRKVWTYSHRENHCSVRTETTPFHQACVPENHHHSFNFTLGHEWQATMYRYSAHGDRLDTVVSRHGCVPISGHFLRHHKDNHVVDRVNYFNVRPHIGNPIIWVLPHACFNATEVKY
eukprot:TRINITY_DN479_c0_g1_i1.p1 TRINITY_DN479_c0_g1~~TRINITY_DN479_c0_g1_i1.p1  ORF type:complete len:200 (-),score=15.30 TRINITY_DN479_c0_g1_i1:45-644(-)